MVAPEEIGSLLRVGSGSPSQVTDDLGSFLDEIVEEVAGVVETQDEPWRKGFREAAETGEREGFNASRLRRLFGSQDEPDGWAETLAAFKADLARLRHIEAELDRLGHRWSDEHRQVVRDPERIDEAEALLAAVTERERPFRVLADGPDLDALAGKVPDLAIKAAEKLVADEGPKYNPLYFWGSPEYAGRALLGGTFRSYRALQPRGRAAITSVTEFAEDFIRALSEGVAGAWRERWWTADLLLVHGLEDLGRTERAQDELFHMFEALKRRGARIFLLADRPPTGMDEIDERLRSRFEGGLVLEVKAESSIAAAAADLTLEEADVPDEVADGLAAEPLAPAGEIETVEEMGPMELGSPAPQATRTGKVLPSGGAGGRDERGEGVAWVPSRESVVWNWPVLEDRILEDLD